MNIGDKISIVTTCPARLFNNKHQGLWRTVQQAYPEVPFYFYHENEYEKKYNNTFIDFNNISIPPSYKIFDLFEEYPNLENFLNTSEFSTCDKYDKNDFNQGYWRHNSKFWFRKAPAIYHAYKNCNTPFLLFLDSDSRITENRSKIDENYIKYVEQYDVASRLRGSVHTETGQIVFNLEKKGGQFIEEFYDYYMSSKVFNLHRWDDCWVFDTIRKDKKYKVGTLSVKVDSIKLDEIVHHDKGQWKDIRSSVN